MSPEISPLAVVHPRAELAPNVVVGPFCVVGPDVVIGPGCQLDSHVTIVGHTTIGANNRFGPHSVIGTEPQDLGYKDAPTQVEIGDGNFFREGVTVHRGAEKEDGVTRIGNGCQLFANSHVGHNCRLYNQVMLVNGVLLGGHCHIHDYAIVSGNTVVHQFTSIGTMAMISGGCRLTTDLPPYFLASGNDNPVVLGLNLVGLKRRGLSSDAIAALKQAYKWMYREHKTLAEIRSLFTEQLPTPWPAELHTLLDFVERTNLGRFGRGREAIRSVPTSLKIPERRAA
jgi:UDP-N-acetylglucosamine acyltransferase